MLAQTFFTVDFRGAMFSPSEFAPFLASANEVKEEISFENAGEYVLQDDGGYKKYLFLRIWESHDSQQ